MNSQLDPNVPPPIASSSAPSSSVVVFSSASIRLFQDVVATAFHFPQSLPLPSPFYFSRHDASCFSAMFGLREAEPGQLMGDQYYWPPLRYIRRMRKPRPSSPSCRRLFSLLAHEVDACSDDSRPGTVITPFLFLPFCFLVQDFRGAFSSPLLARSTIAPLALIIGHCAEDSV